MTDTVIIHEGEFKRVPGYVEHVESMAASANLINLVKSAGDTLERHYPGWLWMIRPDEHGGVCDFFSLLLSGSLAYTLHIPTMQNDPNLKCVVRAGGEILERFGFKRGPYSTEEWHRREQTLGQFIPDVSGLSPEMIRTIRTHQLRNAVLTGHAAITTDPNVGAAIAAARRAGHHVQ